MVTELELSAPRHSLQRARAEVEGSLDHAHGMKPLKYPLRERAQGPSKLGNKSAVPGQRCTPTPWGQTAALGSPRRLTLMPLHQAAHLYPSSYPL